MITMTEAEVDAALARLEPGYGQYCWIQKNVTPCDVSSDKEFQTCFNALYRVQRDWRWRGSFYNLMQAAKVRGISFHDALDALYSDTGRIEASFGSKLVATLDPSKPVIDRIILSHFGLLLPPFMAKDRKAKVLEVYRRLCIAYASLLDSSIGSMIVVRFDRCYKDSGLTSLKKIDLVLRKIRHCRAWADVRRTEAPQK
jgi:hypothetical protein